MNPAAAAEYDRRFFDSFRSTSASSAAAVVPLVLDLVPARSVIDVGCGEGVWLAEFSRRSVTDLLGIDGPHVDPANLLIPRERFLAHDLERPLPPPTRTFDLAVSLETAEHLTPARAASFVADLTALSPVILFSAAIPRQGGSHHVNEQWPAYWADLFAAHHYRWSDTLRPKLWPDQRISWWYRQNLLLFFRDNHPARIPLSTGHPPSLVHPDAWLERTTPKIKKARRKLWPF
jgi:SAM-dependent methyltransferase